MKPPRFLWAGAVLSLSQISPFLPAGSDPDPRPRYESIAQKLRKKHADLDIRFVVGEADAKFVAIDPKLWDSRGETEVFSERDAFGRMLCPKHLRNPGKKHLITVRADEPGDTLLHEYLHYLQVKADPKLCALFNRIEEDPEPGDLKRNDQLEYEVVRFIYDNAPKLKPTLEIRAGLLEKLAKYLKSIPEEVRQANITHGWAPLVATQLESEVAKVVDDYQKALQNKAEYQPTGRYSKTAAKGTAGAKLVHGISLLDGPAPGLKELPLCVSISGGDAAFGSAVVRSVRQWNEAARPLFEKDLFQTRCDPPRIVLDFDSAAGRMADGAIRVGEVYELGETRKLILVRGKELKSFEFMLSAMIHKALSNISDPGLRAIKKKKLAEFRQKQVETRLHNLILHELGHAVGLGHNFKTEDLSVMNYSDVVSLSPYDRSALFLRIKGEPQPGGQWNARLAAPQEEGLGD